MSELPTLEHYWKTDFSNTLKLFQDITVTYKTQDNTSQQAVIKFNIYQDHAANTKFIGFYIPASGDIYQLCIYISTPICNSRYGRYSPRRLRAIKIRGRVRWH